MKPRKTFKQAIFLANREKESRPKLEQKIPLHPGLIVQNYSKEEIISPKIKSKPTTTKRTDAKPTRHQSLEIDR